MTIWDNPVFRRELRRSIPASKWARWLLLAAVASLIVGTTAIGIVVLREKGRGECWELGLLLGVMLHIASTIMSTALIVEGHGRYLQGSGGEQILLTLMRPSDVIRGLVGIVWISWGTILLTSLLIWTVGVASPEACLAAVAWGLITVSNVHMTSSLIIRRAVDESTGYLVRRRLDLCVVQSLLLDFALIGLVLKPIVFIRCMVRRIPESVPADASPPERLQA